MSHSQASRRTVVLFATLTCAISSTLGYAGTLRVGPGQPYSSIQQAIDAASHGDEVLVEPYTYAESLNLGGKAITLRGRTGQLNTYVIAPSPGVSIVSCVTGEGSGTVIDGFTIMNASGAPGIKITGTSPVFRNCTVQNCQLSNASGAALQVGGADPAPRFETCYFQGNRVTQGNGGAASLSSGLTTLVGCVFQSNEVSGTTTNGGFSGGAIHCDTGRVTANNVRFSSNAVRVSHLNTSNNNITARGGAVYIANASSTFLDCVFTSNSARTDSWCCSGSANSTGGTIFEYGSSTTYSGCTISNSQAIAYNASPQARGGAMYFAAGADPTITNCSVDQPRTNPEATGWGGFAFFEGGCSGTITNCTVSGAFATSFGGAIFFQNGAGPVIADCRFTSCSTNNEGGAWYLEGISSGSPSPIALRTTFTSCSSPRGGAIHVRDNSNLVVDSCRFTQCTASSEGGAVYTWYAPISVRNTSFDRNTSPTGSAFRTNGDTNRWPYIGGSFFCSNSGAQASWITGTWFDAPPGGTNLFTPVCSTDCNNNGAFDDAEIATGAAPDCNGNGVPDSCDIASGLEQDCDADGIPNSCEIGKGVGPDCNGNSIPDSCEADCDADGIPNACELASGAPDCNLNGIPDACDLATGTLTDRNLDSIPDSCQTLEYLGLRSEYVPIAGTANDTSIPGTAVCVRVYAEFTTSGAELLGVYGNQAHPMVLTVSGGGFFQAAGGGNLTSDVLCTPEVPLPSFPYDSWLTIGRTCLENNALQSLGFNFGPFVTGNGFTDNDCIAFVTPGAPQAFAGSTKRVLVAQLTSRTGVFPTFRVNLVGRNADASDWEAFSQLAPQPALVDCNGNGVHDVLDVALGGATDCNDSGIPDACEFPDFDADCNANGVADACDIFAGTSQDLDNSGIPDECECVGDVNLDGRVDVDDIVEIILAWGDGAGSPADLNGDGIVSGGDLAIVVGGYGECN
jgi:hypothetical protein